MKWAEEGFHSMRIGEYYFGNDLKARYASSRKMDSHGFDAMQFANTNLVIENP